MNECFFYLCVIKNWLKANLVLHTRELKEDNGKTKTTLSRQESAKAVWLEASGQSGG